MERINHIASITGLRGLLALSVVLYHVYTGSVDGNILKQDYLPKFTSTFGPMAVNLFFVISGYLITKSLIKHQYIKRFALDRVIRIYPVFLTVHLLIFAIGPIVKYSWFANISLISYAYYFFVNLFFLPGLLDLPISQIVAWSLSYEAAFYIMICFYYFIYRKKGIWYLLLPVILIISCYLVYKHPIFLFFIVGILLSWNQLISHIPSLTKIGGLVFLLLSYILYYPGFIYGSLVAAFFFFHSIIKEYGMVSALLSTRIFGYLGKISYSLYLWHTFVMYPVKRLLLKLQLPGEWLGMIIFGLVSIVISLLISHYSYKILEVKLANRLKRLLAGNRDQKQKTLVVAEKSV
ncbi:acyltransferase [Paenibacillus sp. P26]|nr:acyltransferase [Paenibacillus sp. P26]